MLVVLAVLLLAVPSMTEVAIISGIVEGPAGEPLPGATVRIQATRNEDSTDEAGRFRLEVDAPAAPLRVTAWKEGYFVAGAEARAGEEDVRLALTPYPVTDHPGYAWAVPEVERSPLEESRIRESLDAAARESLRDAFFPLAERLDLGCLDCHGDALHEEWAGSAHARGSRNPIFLTMYNGTDVDGNRSPLTRFFHSRDYGSRPLAPAPGEAYFGPGYKLDFPETAGNCAACHLPGAAIGAPYGVDPNSVDGLNRSGSHCDFCHKIVDVVLDPATGRPRENMPGVLSLAFARPGPDHQIFFGPYDDVDVGPDTFLPLMKRSEICAPCHDASFWGTPIYESFAEWKASPWAARGTTCQDCHMRPDGVTTNFAPGRGGVERVPESIPSHGCPGADDEALLRDAVSTDVVARRAIATVDVAVSITNDRTGHHVPTDSPLRQLILVVRAFDDAGSPVALIEGPRLPAWCGEGDPSAGRYAGLPGVAFAKILRESWTGVSPTAAYWNPTRIVSDNRIAAFATDRSRYRFDAGSGGAVRLEVTLLYRRAFIDLIEQKGWNAPDIVVDRRVIVLDPPEGV